MGITVSASLLSLIPLGAAAPGCMRSSERGQTLICVLGHRILVIQCMLNIFGGTMEPLDTLSQSGSQWQKWEIGIKTDEDRERGS